MLFYPNIIDKMASEQGKKYRHKKLQEGFTQSFPNPSLSEIQKRDTQFEQLGSHVNRKISDLARSQQVVNRETNDFLTVASRDQKYLNQMVQTSDGTFAYVTKEGLFKPFNSAQEARETMGRNGCPSQVLQINTGPDTYTKDGKNITGDVPFTVGTPMVNQQGCGYAGENIFVGKVASGGKAKFLGCKKGSGDLVATGFSIPIENPPCPAGTFQCRGSEKGYCYDPRRNQMVSTYMNPNYDKPIGSTGNGAPFLSDDGVTYLWFRQGGFDNKCGQKPTVAPCPKGTAQCPNGDYGYCWDPTRNAMVSTASPYGGEELGAKPAYMWLVQGNYFNYSEKKDDFVSPNSNAPKSAPLQSWFPDTQFSDPNFAPGNKIHLQFKAAAAALMPHLEIGQSSQIKVVSGPNVITWNMQPGTGVKVAGSVNINGRYFFGNVRLNNVKTQSGQLVPRLFIEQQGNTLFLKAPSPNWWSNSYTFYFEQSPATIFGSTSGGGFNSNGATFIVVKESNTSATGTLQYGDSTKTTTFTFSSPIPMRKPGFLAADGRTKLWKKSDGYNSACGAMPSVPPTLKSRELIDQCRAIAAGGGFKVYGIKDNECYIGNSADTMTPGTGCVSMDGGTIGRNGDLAAYEVEGATNSGLFQYGFVTADQTLKQYPKNMLKPTGDFENTGKKTILRAKNRVMFDNVQGVDSCKTSCVSQFGENCEAFRFNGSSRQCEAFGKDTLDSGMIIPSQQDDQLYVRKMAFQNDASCPKTFITVDSAVWNSFPKDGLMNETTLCDLGAVTSDSMNKKIQDLAELNEALDEMEQVVTQEVQSEKTLRPKLKDDMTALTKDIQEYKKLYEGLTNMDSKVKNDMASIKVEGNMGDYLVMGAALLFAGASMMRK